MYFYRIQLHSTTKGDPRHGDLTKMTPYTVLSEASTGGTGVALLLLERAVPLSPIKINCQPLQSYHSLKARLPPMTYIKPSLGPHPATSQVQN